MAIVQTDLTYAGRRLTVKKTLAYFYQDPNTGQLSGYKKPLVPSTKIGTIVRLSEDDVTDRYFVAGEHRPVVVGQAPESPDHLRWSVDQEAAVAEHAQITREKRIAAAGVDPIRKQLDPIKDELAHLSPAARSATIGWIVSYLTSGR